MDTETLNAQREQAENLRIWIERQIADEGINYDTFAERVRSSKSSVYGWVQEFGHPRHRFPNRSTIARMAHAYGMTTAEFYAMLSPTKRVSPTQSLDEREKVHRLVDELDDDDLPSIRRQLQGLVNNSMRDLPRKSRT